MRLIIGKAVLLSLITLDRFSDFESFLSQFIRLSECIVVENGYESLLSATSIGPPSAGFRI
jgi:hypothetical protein